MTYKVLFSFKAYQEFLKTWEWYEDRQAGLGDRFRNVIYKQLHNVEQYPERYPERKKGYREIGTPIFPYLIIYKIKKRSKEILIVSIFHTRRNPKKRYSKQ